MFQVTSLAECASTNLEAGDRSLYRHGDIISALSQTDGRGQRGNKWTSRPGENLTFSVVLEPTFMLARDQFLLSEAISLAICGALKSYGIDARIKWTNDIYVGDRKICGVLIENDLKGENMARSIVGIGLNVNQTAFPEWLPNPTSMSSETGERYDTQEVLHALINELEHWYKVLDGGDYDRIERSYCELLYRRDEQHFYNKPDSGHFEGTIRGVRSSGALVVETDGKLDEYLFKEIEFII